MEPPDDWGRRRHRRIEVGERQRADRAVAEALGVSRAKARELIDSGAVRLRGRRVKKGDPLDAGSTLEVEQELDRPAVVPQPELPLAVLLETPTLIVIDKPAGMACHPLRPGETGTLANALVARYPECLVAGAAPREAGLCHRLDRETSGAILAARTPEAFSALRGEFRERTVEKVYLGLVAGKLERPEGRIELPLGGRGSLTRPWRGARDGRALPALTSYRTLWAGSAGLRAGEPGAGCSLLEVRIETGVRHQIRAHLAAIGHPLMGDVAYGGEPWGSSGRDAGATLPRHFLHAWRLGFRDPADGTFQVVRAPLPADARLALDELGVGHLD